MLDVQDITVAYSSNAEPTIEGFHLKMKPGEICSIVGESGSGKTTVIRSILGLLPGGGKVTKGDILFEGESLLQYSKKQWRELRGTQISMIFQDSGAMNLSYEERLQLLAFLAEIAKSDGNVCAAEINALKEVAMAMGMSDREVESMLNLKGSSLDDAYKVLEIEPTATDEEVRAAYRRMAVKHHPDKVASLGEDIRKAANEKFQKINEAKERIYQSRGLK